MKPERNKSYILSTILPLLQEVGFDYEGDAIEDAEAGYFFFDHEEKEMRVIAGVDEGTLYFSKERIVYYEISLQDLMGIEDEALKRKIATTITLQPLLVPNIPENWSDYVDRNFDLG